MSDLLTYSLIQKCLVSTRCLPTEQRLGSSTSLSTNKCLSTSESLLNNICLAFTKRLVIIKHLTDKGLSNMTKLSAPNVFGH